jgi:hypothetical protein
MGFNKPFRLARQDGPRRTLTPSEDLEAPQRFYVDVEAGERERTSVMDRWEVERRKRDRPRPVQAVGPVQGVQVVEMQKIVRSRKIGATSNGRLQRI